MSRPVAEETLPGTLADFVNEILADGSSREPFVTGTNEATTGWTHVWLRRLVHG